MCADVEHNRNGRWKAWRQLRYQHLERIDATRRSANSDEVSLGQDDSGLYQDVAAILMPSTKEQIRRRSETRVRCPLGTQQAVDEYLSCGVAAHHGIGFGAREYAGPAD
jgi:hypothetical protein